MSPIRGPRDGDALARHIGAEDTPEALEPQQQAAGRDDRGERMAGAGDAHGQISRAAACATIAASSSSEPFCPCGARRTTDCRPNCASGRPRRGERASIAKFRSWSPPSKRRMRESAQNPQRLSGPRRAVAVKRLRRSCALLQPLTRRREDGVATSGLASPRPPSATGQRQPDEGDDFARAGDEADRVDRPRAIVQAPSDEPIATPT